MNGLYGQLIASLRLAASSSDIQVQSLPAFVHVPDEIALIFDDAWSNFRGGEADVSVSDSAHEWLDKLERLYDEMSSDKGLWTIEMLATHSLWEETRRIASEALSAMNEQNAPPDLSFISWVR